MQAYQSTAPEHMLLVPDHYPKIPGDSPWGHQTRAYAIGYIKALIRATGSPSHGWWESQRTEPDPVSGLKAAEMGGGAMVVGQIHLLPEP
jgi:hypothetical protein